MGWVQEEVELYGVHLKLSYERCINEAFGQA